MRAGLDVVGDILSNESGGRYDGTPQDKNLSRIIKMGQGIGFDVF